MDKQDLNNQQLWHKDLQNINKRPFDFGCGFVLGIISFGLVETLFYLIDKYNL